MVIEYILRGLEKSNANWKIGRTGILEDFSYTRVPFLSEACLSLQLPFHERRLGEHCRRSG